MLIAFIGLSGAGKTAMEHSLSNNYEDTVPSIGNNIVTIDQVVGLHQFKFKIVDIAGTNSDEGDEAMKEEIDKADAVCYVIDSKEEEFNKNLKRIKTQLAQIIAASAKPILVFLNKQDLPDAKRREQILIDIGLDLDVLSKRVEGENEPRILVIES